MLSTPHLTSTPDIVGGALNSPRHSPSPVLPHLSLPPGGASDLDDLQKTEATDPNNTNKVAPDELSDEELRRIYDDEEVEHFLSLFSTVSMMY